ncbi:MAG: transcription termination/antitermination protein NusG [bacterium]|nr:transcription termination/antitermination protein NusG [bacterium]MCY3580140.1 transcription termination/antitermination protein NusG [bacterium]MCY3651411.1 transcription termination/antitermination protein NusG [bacterium]MDE0643382.1 transcription termination/antitermination protein NusG [bacterium]
MTEPTTTDQDQAPSEEATESDTMLSTLGAAFRSAGFRSDGSRDETEPPAEPSPSPEDPFTTATEPAASSALETAEESSDNLPAVEEGLPLEPEEDPVSPYDKRGSWYVIHSYSGHEKKVRANLDTLKASQHLEESIFEVVIPTEKVVEIKGGRKVEVERRMFPGYILIRMYDDADTFNVVRNAPGVTSFVGSGMGGGFQPSPLSRREVERFLGLKKESAKKAPRFRPAWDIGETVRVTKGAFADFNGVVENINIDQQKVTVLVEIFGRDTPMVLGFEDIQKQ